MGFRFDASGFGVSGSRVWGLGFQVLGSGF